MDFGIISMMFNNFCACARNLYNIQKQLFLQWVCMFLHIRKTWFLMVFIMFFATNFGIGFWSLWASVLAPLWHPFGIHWHPFHILFPNFSALVLQRVLCEVHFLFWHPFGSFLVSFWHPFGSLLVSFSFLLAPFFLPFAAGTPQTRKHTKYKHTKQITNQRSAKEAVKSIVALP